jgi:hypothetical protein
MSLDISHILSGWPFKPGEVNVRRIKGDDGLEKIQLRLDLGILQMEITGRPDGTRPHGFESLLDYFRDELAKHRQVTGSTADFHLDSEDCEALRSESIMYYHRYLAMFVLGDYEAVAEDTKRNLELFDFCLTYAEQDQDRYYLEQYRPYVQMMYTRARARLAMERQSITEALGIVRAGIKDIQKTCEEFEQGEDVAVTELAVLKALAREIESREQLDPVARLRKQLREAIEEERYEDAADIRDELDRVKHEAE